MAVSAILLVFSVLILLLCVFLYRKYGRDKKVIPVVEFFPPDGLNPAEIGMVIDRTVSARDVTSLVFYWASKGYLTISEEKKHFTLTKVKDMEPTRDLYERNAFNKLWEIGDGQSVTDKQLNLNYYQTLSATSMAITRKYKEEKNLENPKSKKMSVLGFLLCAIAFAAPAAAQGLYQHEAVLTVISLAFLALFSVVSYSLFTYAQEKTPKISKGASVALYVVGAVLSVVFFAVSVLVSCYSGILQTALVAPALAMAMAGVVLSAFITQRSSYGQQILERTVGFKQFLLTAEKDKLEALLEETPSYFYDILPYALVLGVSDKWAGKFDQMIHEPPQWYACGRTDTFTTIWLLNSMQHSMNRVSQSFAATPQPSGTTSGGGFSGGGFSGGGSGGGGGSAW